eukprot:scaffold284085_cov32-Tisochrysis_lutea.AAC.1
MRSMRRPQPATIVVCQPIGGLPVAMHRPPTFGVRVVSARDRSTCGMFVGSVDRSGAFSTISISASLHPCHTSADVGRHLSRVGA